MAYPVLRLRAGWSGAAAGLSSPDSLRGVMWNLPGGIASAAVHPPVVSARPVLDFQDDPEHGGIGSRRRTHTAPGGGWSSHRAGRAEHCRRRARDNRHSLKPRLLHTRHPTPVRTIGGERHGPPLRFQLLLKLFSDDRVRIPRQDAPATLRSQSDGLGQTLLFHLQHVGTLVGPLYG